MNTKTVKGIVIAAVIAVAGYWYWSPFIAAWQMKTAIMEKDADSFNERVDYPKLRESLKGQFSASLEKKMSQSSGDTNGFEALGTMLGLAMADKVVDAMVRPEAVMRMMQEGRAAAANNSDTQDGNSSTATTPDWSYERKGVNKLIIYVKKPDAAETGKSDKLGLVFQRNGFVDWKLTELRLPNLSM